jgi:chromosome partitioning protein
VIDSPLSDWTGSREADEGPDFERIDATALDKALSTLKAEGYDLT